MMYMCYVYIIYREKVMKSKAEKSWGHSYSNFSEHARGAEYFQIICPNPAREASLFVVFAVADADHGEAVHGALVALDQGVPVGREQQFVAVDDLEVIDQWAAFLLGQPDALGLVRLAEKKNSKIVFQRYFFSKTADEKTTIQKA